MPGTGILSSDDADKIERDFANAEVTMLEIRGEAMSDSTFHFN